MKNLLLILLAIPVIGVGQLNINKDNPYVILNTKQVSYLDSLYEARGNPDTIPSSILISHKAPSFGHAIDGYCIYRHGQCTGKHLKVWRKKLIVIPTQYTIWRCIRRDKK